MIDSTRPVAPYLPAEITSQILDYIHPTSEKEPCGFVSLSRVGAGWRMYGQSRLFETIKINNLRQRQKLVSIVGSPLLNHTKSLHFQLRVIHEDSSHLLSLLLKSTMNLNLLSLDIP